MNKVGDVLLLLSVVGTASAIAVGDQRHNEQYFELDGSEHQKQSEGNSIPLSNSPWGKNQDSEIIDEAVKIRSGAFGSVASANRGSQPSDQGYDEPDSVEQIVRKLQAMQERNLAALQDAPRTLKSRCVENKECISWTVISKECTSSVFWVCVDWKETKACSRWITTCLPGRPQRGNEDESPVHSPSTGTESDNSQKASNTIDGDQVISVEEQNVAVAKLQSESLTNFRNVNDEKVVKAEKYKLLTSMSGENVNSIEEKFHAVIVTLADGRRFAIALGRELWHDKTSAILNADEHFADKSNNWQLVESKSIHFSTVGDFVHESDSSNSPREAAEKMMALN